VDGYSQNLASVNVSGPIIKGKTPNDPAKMGFLIVAEGNYDVDGYPARGGTWTAKPETIQDIIANPTHIDWINGTYVPSYRANMLESNDFQNIRTRQNAQNWGFVTTGKIDVMGGGKDARGRAKNNLRFSVTGTYTYIKARNWNNQSYALFNSANNNITTNNTLRLSARLNHRVKTDTAANAILKNIMYDINVNYTLYNGKTEDRIHKDNLFNYGYIGKFNTEREDYYTVERMKIEIGPGDSIEAPVTVISQYQSVRWVGFDKDGYFNVGNPDLIPYTQYFIDWIKEQTGVDVGTATEDEKRIVEQFLGAFLTYEQYQTYYGLLNGSSPDVIANGLYLAPGVLNSSSYSKSRTESFGAKASLSLNLKDHEIKFGFELEKLTQRSYSVNARGLWGLMRNLTYDASYFPFDRDNPYWISGEPYPILDPITGEVLDTLMYPIIPNLTNFDINLRKAKGITDNTVFLDIDSYDPNEFMSYGGLNLFSNYELLNLGNNYISYAGYDYTGNLSKNKIDLKSFFSSDELHDKNKYSIGAYEPIYLAFFLQDKFSIQNLLFSVGLRLDYMNANQYVLKDEFLFRPVYNVQELQDAGWYIPIDNWGADWIPYVGVANLDIDNAPQSIVAYRSGKTWYNSLGQEVADPSSYLGTGGPVLREQLNPEDMSKVSYDAFTRYKPYWSLMPRISFSFPVSTNSLFYAHYNIITYRPPNLQINPIAYLFIENTTYRNSVISNPNLKAQRTVVYEIGFRQAVGENSALGISAFYNEIRDQIQTYRYTGAYPATYYSFENADFGTTQGYVLEFTMRGTKNLSFRANYTLQFAKGTGSNAESNLAIIASGQPNLRTLTNLNYDQRHSIGASVDFRYGQGTNYNGPVTRKLKKGTETTKEIRWLENAGANLLFTAGSGMPYSRKSLVYSSVWGETKTSPLKGTINGANMPWTFTCNLRVDKTLFFNLASKKNTEEGGQRKNKPGMLTVYLDFQNLLNLKNVISVYDHTGNPVDDGYLSSSLFLTSVQNGIVFSTMSDAAARNYYQMYIANPYNYSLPFRATLGVQFSF